MADRKNIMRSFAAFLLAGLCFLSALPKQADAAEWYVSFNGSGLNANFNSSMIADAVSGMQPDDSTSFSVDIRNNSNKAADWYMSNDVIQSMEESIRMQAGAAYSYKLEYRSADGQDTVLYDSDTVGGENSEGLGEASSALADYFYLDRMAAGQSGQVVLTVGLDGETVINSYQDSMATIQMTFAVEGVETPEQPPRFPRPTPPAPSVPDPEPEKPSNTPKPSNPSKPSQPSKPASTPEYETIEDERPPLITLTTPQTGDDGSAIIWSVAACGFGSALFIYGFVMLKGKKRKEDGEHA